MRVYTALGLAAAAVLLAGGSGTTSADDAITVFPPKAVPGSTILVRVSCGEGAQWVEYSSPAFPEPSRIALDGTTEVEKRFVLADDLEPGDYPIRGECGAAESSRVRYANVTVPAEPERAVPSPAPTPSGAPNTGGGGLSRSGGRLGRA